MSLCCKNNTANDLCLDTCIVRNDFLPPPSLIATPPTWGTPPAFFKVLPPSYVCKFQCLDARKIHHFRSIFLVVFVKKINFLIDCMDFTIKTNHQCKGRFDLLLTTVYMNQNDIDHADICSTPPAKILPPQLGLPPSIFEIFSTPQRGKFQKSPTPQLGGSNYDSSHGVILSCTIYWYMSRQKVS